jgi:hypothetical protein
MQQRLGVAAGPGQHFENQLGSRLVGHIRGEVARNVFVQLVADVLFFTTAGMRSKV